MERITHFAFVIERTKEGNNISICGKEYAAWDYDVYIYDAIQLGAKWLPHQITYERIVYLRYWLRENVQHGHDRCFDHLKSMHSVKQWLAGLIAAEYRDEEYWKEQKEYALKQNEEIFIKSNDVQTQNIQ